MPARIVRLAITATPNTGITSDAIPVPCSVAAAFRARQAKQPQHRRRHHHGLARADDQPAQDQDSERATAE
jgi:hypothetical protein